MKTAVVISPPDQREGYDEVDEEPKDRVLKFWNKMIEAYSDPQKYEGHIKSEFIDGDELDILIVVNKLLRGFDAPRASVLYVYKPMKEHILLQAIARVDLLFEGKDFGLIVDYRGLIQELDSAMKTYSGTGLENFEGKDLEGALVDIISKIKPMIRLAKYWNVRQTHVYSSYSLEEYIVNRSYGYYTNSVFDYFADFALSLPTSH